MSRVIFVGPLLQQIAKAVWRARVSQFWPIWITITVAAAICVAWVVRQAETPMVREGKKTRIDHVSPRGAVAVLLVLALFLVVYIALMLTWEDFTYYDNSWFTLDTLKGHKLFPPIEPGSGRFFPLGHQEFNLIRHFTGTVVGYHVLPIVQLLILSFVILILDDELSITARAVLTALVLITPGTVISFDTLIVSERNVILWLACLVLSVRHFEQTQSAAWAVAAVVCAQIMIYYKETAFLLLLGFAVGRLILRCRNADHAGWAFNRLRDKESRLDVCLASLGVLFLLYYVAVMLPHFHMQYAEENRIPPAEVFLAYIKLDLLAWLLVAVLLGRACLILRHRVVPSLLWDGLALGGVGCFTAYLCLGMVSLYYLAPVDLIAVLYIGRFAILSRGKVKLWSKVASSILLFAVLIQNASLSAFFVFEEKNIIHAKAEIARVVEARYQGGVGNVKRLFFPFANPYVIMQFASYLNYLGVPVEGATVESVGLNSVVMVSRVAAKDGPCVAYESRVVCHSCSRPEPTDLVIVLPDDDASLAEVIPFRDGGELLASYEPRPCIPQWLYPFVRCLHIASPIFARKELPDRWLHASVTAWQ